MNLTLFASNDVTPKREDDLHSLIYGNGQNKPATIVFHEDAGHGWLQVPHSLIKKLKIAAKITGYSYMDSNYVYLEEDCDLSTFFTALGISKETVQSFWQICPNEYKETSPIRSKRDYSIKIG